MNFSELLLNTAFSCMACDGEIAKEEVDLIKKLATTMEEFKGLDIDKELNGLVEEINKTGKGFLKEYLDYVNKQELSKEEEMKILQVAFDTIQADNKVEYSEVKFFKVIRSNLKLVTDKEILEGIDGIDEMYVSQDIKVSYLQMFDDYFSQVEFSEFKIQ